MRQKELTEEGGKPREFSVLEAKGGGSFEFYENRSHDFVLLL